jgi:hypothetical protein
MLTILLVVVVLTLLGARYRPGHRVITRAAASVSSCWFWSF